MVQRAKCRSISNNFYLSIKREALLKLTTEVRKTVQLEMAKVKAKSKKLRDDKEKVMEVLFGLFEKHQYYNIRDLVKETSQPVAYLKKVLKAYVFVSIEALGRRARH